MTLVSTHTGRGQGCVMVLVSWGQRISPYCQQCEGGGLVSRLPPDIMQPYWINQECWFCLNSKPMIYTHHSRDGSIRRYVAMSGHHFSPDLNISKTIGRTAMKLCADARVPGHRSLLILMIPWLLIYCHQQVRLFYLSSYISKSSRWLGTKFATDTPGSHKLYPNDWGSMTFPQAQSLG